MTTSDSIKRRSTGRKIGDNIKKALHKRRKTQLWLADKLDVTKQHVNKWCTNTNKPSSEYLKKIADALDYSVQEIVTGNFYDEMEKIAREEQEEYRDIIEEEKRSIKNTLDILSSDPDISEKKREAYKDSVMRKIDMIIHIVSS